VTRALTGVGGVETVKIDLAEGTATVAHTGADLETMKAAIDDAGYEVVGVQ
jgi:copper chaperone CopZ